MAYGLRTVVKKPGVAKPPDWKPYVPPAPKEKVKRKKVSDETIKRRARERQRKKVKAMAEESAEEAPPEPMEEDSDIDESLLALAMDCTVEQLRG